MTSRVLISFKNPVVRMFRIVSWFFHPSTSCPLLHPPPQRMSHPPSFNEALGNVLARCLVRSVVGTRHKCWPILYLTPVSSLKLKQDFLQFLCIWLSYNSPFSLGVRETFRVVIGEPTACHLVFVQPILIIYPARRRAVQRYVCHSNYPRFIIPDFF